jgi:hypothetical protein
VQPLYDIWIYYRSQIKDIILEFGISYLPRHPLLPIVSASLSPIYGIPRILRCGGLSPGVLREVVPQVISVTYDPSSVEYDSEANPIVDVNPLIKVKQEGVDRNASRTERSVTNSDNVWMTQGLRLAKQETKGNISRFLG